jgi:hypothetical protein
METVRESWTDERLDDLSHRVDEGFRRIDADIRELRAEMTAFHRMILQLGGGMIVTFAVGFAGLIIAQL